MKIIHIFIVCGLILFVKLIQASDDLVEKDASSLELASSGSSSTSSSIDPSSLALSEEIHTKAKRKFKHLRHRKWL